MTRRPGIERRDSEWGRKGLKKVVVSRHEINRPYPMEQQESYREGRIPYWKVGAEGARGALLSLTLNLSNTSSRCRIPNDSE